MERGRVPGRGGWLELQSPCGCSPKCRLPLWPLAFGGASGLGTSPEWGGVVGQTRFHMPFPGEHRPEHLPWVLPCFQSLQGFLHPDCSPGKSGFAASPVSWAVPWQLTPLSQRASVSWAARNQQRRAVRLNQPQNRGKWGAARPQSCCSRSAPAYRAGVSLSAMLRGGWCGAGGHRVGPGAAEPTALLSPQAGPACTTKPRCALSRSAPRTRAGTSAKCSCWTSSTTPSTTAAGSTSRSMVSGAGGRALRRCRDGLPFDCGCTPDLDGACASQTSEPEALQADCSSRGVTEKGTHFY